MKKILLFLTLGIPSLALSQVVLGQVDTFEDYTMQNWTKNNSIPNSNIYDGGPLGVGDNFLRVQSSGTGTNLNLMTKNNSQWTGNYYQNNLSNRIKYISMDVRNSGTNIIFLRLSFKTIYGSFTYLCSTTNAIAVLPNEGWKKISFSILESNIIALSTPWDYQVTFGSNGVDEMRILHSSVPSWEAEPNAAILDIDNIMAENQTLSIADFQIDNKLVLYPNPSNELIIIKNNFNTSENFVYKIIDITGRIMTTGNSSYNETINIASLTAGNYFIQIETESGQKFNEKLIKK
jgi:hypothetical protein